MNKIDLCEQELLNNMPQFIEIKGRLNRLAWKCQDGDNGGECDSESPGEQLNFDAALAVSKAVALLSWIRMARAAVSATSLEQHTRREAAKKRMVEVSRICTCVVSTRYFEKFLYGRLISMFEYLQSFLLKIIYRTFDLL